MKKFLPNLLLLISINCFISAAPAAKRYELKATTDITISKTPHVVNAELIHPLDILVYRFN